MSEPHIHPKLADLVLKVWDEGLVMRANGASVEARDEHIRDRLLTFATQIGMVYSETNLPQWQLNRCPVCRDDGWVQTSRIVRNEEVEAYRRCSCKPVGMSSRETDQAAAVDRVASGWKRTVRR